MKKKSVGVAAGLLGAILLTGRSVVSAPDPEAKAQGESLELRYARAQLQLAEVNLRRVERANQQVRGVIPASLVAEYRDDVEVAKVRVQNATQAQGEDEFPVWLRAAEAAARGADTQWHAAIAMNQARPGTVDDLEVERLRLRSEIARLRLAQGRALTGKPAEAQAQWQIKVLNDEVQRLKEEVLRTSTTRPYSIWWY